MEESGQSSEDNYSVIAELAQRSLLGSPGSAQLPGSAYVPIPMGRNAAGWFGHSPWTCHTGSRRGQMT